MQAKIISTAAQGRNTCSINSVQVRLRQIENKILVLEKRKQKVSMPLMFNSKTSTTAGNSIIEQLSSHYTIPAEITKAFLMTPNILHERALISALAQTFKKKLHIYSGNINNELIQIAIELFIYKAVQQQLLDQLERSLDTRTQKPKITSNPYERIVSFIKRMLG